MKKNAVIYLTSRVINGVLSIAIVMMLTRMLSPQEYGVYSLSFAGMSFLAVVFFQWIGVSANRFIAEKIDDLGHVQREIFQLIKIVSLVILFLCVISYLIFKDKYPHPILLPIIFLGSIGLGIQSIGLQVASAKMQPLRYGLHSFSRLALSILLSFCVLQLGYQSIGVVIATLISIALSNILFFPFFKTDKNSENYLLRKKIISYGIPLSISALSISVLDLSDRFMIGYFLGADYAGIYSASYDITQQTIGAFLNVIYISSFPLIVGYWGQEKTDKYNDEINGLMRILFWFSALILGFYISSPEKVSSLFFSGNIKSGSESVMPIIAAAVTVGCLKSYLIDIPIQLKKNTKLHLKISIVMALSNLMMNVLFIPRFGIIGSAYATFASFLIGSILSYRAGVIAGFNFVNIKVVGSFFLLLTISVGLSNLINFNFIEYMYPRVILEIGVIFAIYFTILFLFNFTGVREFVINLKNNH